MGIRMAILLLFFLICYFPLFLHLDVAPFRIWDESLFAMRAYYLAEFGQYLPNFEFFPGMTFYRNLKPPFTSFIQAISFRIIGYNELGLRLPIALLALATAYLNLIISFKLTRSWIPGIAAALILVSSQGYVGWHLSRSGDQDVAIAFYLLGLLFSYYYYLEATEKREKRRYLVLMVFLLLIGFLTKSIVAFFFIPGFVLYAIYKKQLLSVLKSGQVYLGVGIIVGGILGYYLFMERYFPGFWQYESETVYGRYLEERNNQGHHFLHYFLFFGKRDFFPWVFLFPLSALAIFFRPQPKVKDLSILLWFCLLTYLLIISFSETKLHWYDTSVYPLAALLAGLGIYHTVSLFIFKKAWIKSLILVACLILGLIGPYQKMVKSVYFPRIDHTEEHYGSLIRMVKKQQPEIKHYTVWCRPFNGQVAFYAGVLNRENDYHIEVVNNKPILEKGKYLLICRDNQAEEVKKAGFNLKVINQYESCKLIELQ